MLLKKEYSISGSEILKARVMIYDAVIRTASVNALQKSEVIPIAEKIWDAIIEPLTEEQKSIPDR